jgi:hypothetical protein
MLVDRYPQLYQQQQEEEEEEESQGQRKVNVTST